MANEFEAEYSDLRPSRCNPRTRHSMRALLREISQILYSVPPGRYRLTVEVVSPGRYTIPANKGGK